MNKRRSSLIIALLCICFAGEAKAEKSFVSFNIVCKTKSTGCSQAIVQSTKEEIFVEDQSILSLSDVASASYGTRDSSATSSRAQEVLPPGFKTSPGKDYWVDLTFKTPNALGQATSNHIGERVAVFINNEVVMVPTLREPINGNSIRVSGAYIAEHGQLLADEINDSIHENTQKK